VYPGANQECKIECKMTIDMEYVSPLGGGLRGQMSPGRNPWRFLRSGTTWVQVEFHPHGFEELPRGVPLDVRSPFLIGIGPFSLHRQWN